MAIVLLIQVSMYGICWRKGHLPWIIVVVEDATCSVPTIIFMIIVVYPYSARDLVKSVISSQLPQSKTLSLSSGTSMIWGVESLLLTDMSTGGSPADVMITFFDFLAIFFSEVVGIWGTGGRTIASNCEIEGPDSWEEWDALLDSKIWLAKEMASGAMVGGAGYSRRSSKDIVFRVWIVSVTFILLSIPLSIWRVLGPTFLDTPVKFWAVLHRSGYRRVCNSIRIYQHNGHGIGTCPLWLQSNHWAYCRSS